MTERRARTVAAVAWIGTALAALATATLVVVRGDPVVPNTFGMGHTAMLAFLVFGIAWTTVGALLVVNRPGNLVGRISLVVGVAYVSSILGTAIVFACVRDGSPTALSIASWIGWSTGLVTILGFLGFLLAIYFPTGRGHTRAWHGLGQTSVVLVAIFAVLLLTQPGSLHLFPSLRNPVGVGLDVRPVFGPSAFAVVSLAACATLPIVAAAFVSRYRFAGTTERLQLRWYAAATVAWIAGLVLVTTAGVLLPGQLGELPLTVFALTGVLVPVAIGVAILRYRLYDIDRLISRTLGYVVVSTVLAVAFVTSTLVLGALLGQLAQGETIAVAVATLLVAASFGSVRRRAQAIVDRRFDRAGYDAAQIVLELTAHLRDDVDLAHLAGDVLSAVDVTLHPTSRSLWIRPTGATSGDQPAVTISGRSLPMVTPT